MSQRIDRLTRKAVRLFFIFFMIIGTLMAGMISLMYQAELNTFITEIKVQERYVLGRQNSAIRDKFNSIVSDLLFLVKRNELHTCLETGDEQHLIQMEEEYLAISATKKIYDQIRFLSLNGMEKVRVNFNNDNPARVVKKQLQNKGGRYYFTDVISLKQNEIFISPLDLNMESGKVENPFKPMIRFGTPVFDHSGTKQGIVLLNYLATDLLRLLGSEMDQAKSKKMLLNRDGYWLHHADKEKEWGFMLGDRKEVSFVNTYPDEWEEFKQLKKGQIETENGLFTFTSIYPLQEGFRSSSGSSDVYTPSVKELVPTEYFWILVSHIPRDVMASKQCNS